MNKSTLMKGRQLLMESKRSKSMAGQDAQNAGEEEGKEEESRGGGWIGGVGAGQGVDLGYKKGSKISEEWMVVRAEDLSQANPIIN